MEVYAQDGWELPLSSGFLAPASVFRTLNHNPATPGSPSSTPQRVLFLFFCIFRGSLGQGGCSLPPLPLLQKGASRD